MTVLKSVFRRPLRRVSGRGPSRGLSPQALDRGGAGGSTDAGPTEPAGCPQRPPQVLCARVLLAAEERAFGAFGAQLIFLKEKKVKLARRLPFLS